MLYWGEGDKMPRGSLRLTNTDPKMIGVFVAFLKKAMGIQKEKIRAELILYPDLSDMRCKTFWGKITGLQKKNFMKILYYTKAAIPRNDFHMEFV